MRRAAYLAVTATVLAAQDFSQRGFLEFRGVGFPQAAHNDRSHAVAAVLLRYEATYRVGGWRLAGGLDARTDTHHETERRWALSLLDRERQRPSFAVRRASVAYERPGLTVELGKQFVRWGKTDIVNPTDRFAPRDYLAVVDTDFLAVPAVRVAAGAQSDTVELVWAPLFTPSRIPLLNQRWTPVAASPVPAELRERPPRWPRRPQFGARWNHVGRGWEGSLSLYEGYHHLPAFQGQALARAPVLRAELEPVYPRLRMYGADAALPAGPVTLKAEAAWLRSPRNQADEYLLYVVQAERQAGDWFLVGGYAGYRNTRLGPLPLFAADRGLARAFLGRAGYTIDARRSVAFEGAVRRNGDGLWAKFEYSQSFGRHWRATGAFTLIRGSPLDFLGRYRRNSHVLLVVRYSF
ncbi:MAG: hypothetical protein NZ554_08700 [Bryobacteraceae bacterium]|nr:hypothetical protein [Bryobacteraceae bacterium]